MRYHVPRDGFVWHSDLAQKRRWPKVVGVATLAAVCFGAGVFAPRVFSPASLMASTKVWDAGGKSSNQAVIVPMAPQPTGEQSASLDSPIKTPVLSTPSDSVSILNKQTDDEDDVVEVPKKREPSAASAESKRAARSRTVRAEPLPSPASPPATRARSGGWGETGPAGYSALRDSIFDR